MKKFEQVIIDDLVSKMLPTGVWANFNKNIEYYEFLQKLVKLNLMDETDLPPKPIPSDY